MCDCWILKYQHLLALCDVHVDVLKLETDKFSSVNVTGIQT